MTSHMRDLLYPKLESYPCSHPKIYKFQRSVMKGGRGQLNMTLGNIVPHSKFQSVFYRLSLNDWTNWQYSFGAFVEKIAYGCHKLIGVWLEIGHEKRRLIISCECVWQLWAKCIPLTRPLLAIFDSPLFIENFAFRRSSICWKECQKCTVPFTEERYFVW